jgi:nitrogen fixation/metabolism regulation signal transduction histidine kinase
MSQVITNLLQNSVNALTEKSNAERDKAEKKQDMLAQRGKILLKIEQYNRRLYVQVEDNGPGFPKEGRDHLLEPYYTTREQGTGLGLAIVSKIVSDHNGQLHLGNSKLGGACVQLVFDYPE